jgi:hypothetical protein
VSITDSGSGSPRQGEVLIEWTTAVEDGHLLGYHYGDISYNVPGNQTTNALAQFPFFEILVERIAALEDSSTPFFYPGIPVQPLNSTLTLTRGGGAPSPNVAPGVTFNADGTLDIDTAGTEPGTASATFNDDSTLDITG